MKASKLIHELTSAIKKHGDMDVFVMHDGDGSYQHVDFPRIHDRGSIDIDSEDSDDSSKAVVFVWDF